MVAIVQCLRDLRISYRCWWRLNLLGCDTLPVAKNWTDGFEDHAAPIFRGLCSTCLDVLLVWVWIFAATVLILNVPYVRYASSVSNDHLSLSERHSELATVRIQTVLFISLEVHTTNFHYDRDHKEWCRKCLRVCFWRIYFTHDRYKFIPRHRSREEFESECEWDCFVS